MTLTLILQQHRHGPHAKILLNGQNPTSWSDSNDKNPHARHNLDESQLPSVMPIHLSLSLSCLKHLLCQ